MEGYHLCNKFPADEKFGMTAQIRRAALSVLLNIAEGASRKSDIERKRFYKIARGSLIEIDAALDIAFSLSYVSQTDMEETGNTMLRIFQMLSKLITAVKN